MLMPYGIGGEDLIAAARRLRPSMKTLLTSGCCGQSLEQAVGGVQLINKPDRKETLATAVRDALTHSIGQ